MQNAHVRTTLLTVLLIIGLTGGENNKLSGKVPVAQGIHVREKVKQSVGVTTEILHVK
jgi:hypothetical protein